VTNICCKQQIIKDFRYRCLGAVKPSIGRLQLWHQSINDADDEGGDDDNVVVYDDDDTASHLEDRSLVNDVYKCMRYLRVRKG